MSRFRFCANPSASPLPAPSRAGSLGTCNADTERVCNDGFRSCNSVCSVLGASCSDRCCSQFTACLHQRQCDTGGINCFAGPSFEVGPAGQTTPP